MDSSEHVREKGIKLELKQLLINDFIYYPFQYLRRLGLCDTRKVL